MEESLENWNPMKEDFDAVSFNSYDQGPGKNMPRGGTVQLYVTGIPDELSEKGMLNMFGQCGEIIEVKKMNSTKPGHYGTFGFVHFTTVSEASEGIRRFNGKTFVNGRYKLRVQFAKQKAAKASEQMNQQMSRNFNERPQFPAGRGFTKGSSQREPGNKRPENGHSSGYDSTNSGEPSLGRQSVGHHSNFSSASQLSGSSHGDDGSFEDTAWQERDHGAAANNRGGAFTRGSRGRGYHSQGIGRGYSPQGSGRGYQGPGEGGYQPQGTGRECYQTQGQGRGYQGPGGEGYQMQGPVQGYQGPGGEGYHPQGPVRGFQGPGGGGYHPAQTGGAVLMGGQYRGAGSQNRGYRERETGRGFHVPGNRETMSVDPRSEYSHQGGHQEMARQFHNAPQQVMSPDQDETSSVGSSVTDKFCQNCGIPAVDRCKKCKLSYYCGRECQRADWSIHRVQCKESFKDECRYWLIFGHCSKRATCTLNHLIPSQGKFAYMREDAAYLGLCTPINGSECLFWRLTGECVQADMCLFDHFPSSQGADRQCFYWRSGHCYHGDNCSFLHYPENWGIDPVEDSQRQLLQQLQKECVYWRTSGCRNGAQCIYLHLPESQGVDFEKWQQTKRQQRAEAMGIRNPPLKEAWINNNHPGLIPFRETGLETEEESNLDDYLDNHSSLLRKPEMMLSRSPLSEGGWAHSLRIELSSGDMTRRSITDLNDDSGPPDLEPDPGPPKSEQSDDLLSKSAFEQRFKVSCDPEAVVQELFENTVRALGDDKITKTDRDRDVKTQREPLPVGRGPQSGDQTSGGTSRGVAATGSGKVEEKWVSSKDRPSTVNINRQDKSKKSVMSGSDSDRDRKSADRTVRQRETRITGTGDQPSRDKTTENQSTGAKDGGGDARTTLKDQNKQEAGSSTFRGRIKWNNVQQESLSEGKSTKVMVTHFEHPGKFYLTKTETLQASIDLMGELAQAYGSSECTGYTPERREVIAARFREDGCWYRARVDAIDLNGAIRVTFVDYGNCDEVSVSDVRKIKPEFVSLPSQGMLSQLNVSPMGFQWCTEALELCGTELMTPMKELDATLLKVSRDHQVVDLVDPSLDTNVARVLLSKGLARKVQPPEGSQSAGVSSPNARVPVSTEVQKAGSSSPSSVHQNEVKKVTQILPPPIAPLPLPTAAKSIKPGNMLTLQVLEVVSPSQFYIQVSSEDLGLLDKLAQGLEEHYSALPPRKDFKVNADKLYACKFTADGKWYRALAYEFTPTKISVHYLDFGNYEAVPHSHLHPLEGNYRSLQFQALCCSLVAIEAPDGGPWPTEACDYMRELVCDQTLEAIVVEKDNAQLHIEIVDDKKQSINSLLIEKGFAREKQAPGSGRTDRTQKEADTVKTEAAVSFVKVTDLPKVEIGENRELTVQVSHAPSPTDLVVQILEPEHPMLVKFMELTQCLVEIEEAPYRPVGVGELVCARYTEDKCWYRAEVLQLTQSAAKVHFIDYGNIEEVGTSSICKLPTNLLKYPCLAIRCTLAGVRGFASGRTWDPNLLQPLVKPWRIQIEAVDPSSGRLVVDLYDTTGGESLRKELQDQGLIEPIIKAQASTVISSPDHSRVVSNTSSGSFSKVNYGTFKQEVCTVCVLYYVGPHEMYASCLDDEDTVDKFVQLSMQLNTTYTDSMEVYRPRKGELVVAFSEEFKEWYRAEVISAPSEDTVFVYYIDYGNQAKCPVTLVRKIRPEFAEQSTQVIRCSLFGLDEKSVRWSGVAIQKLEALTTGVRLKVRVAGKKENASAHTAIITELRTESGDRDLVQALVDDGCLREENVGWQKTNKSDQSAEGGGSLVGTPGVKSQNIPAASSGNAAANTAFSGSRVLASHVQVQQLPDRRVKVHVIHADCVDFFYVQLEVEELSRKLNEMQKRINDNVPPGPHQPKVGELVLAPFESMWYRAEVKAIKQDSSMVKVFFIDFGNSVQLTMTNIRKLNENFSKLPQQAVKCCLGGIQGNEGSAKGTWSSKAKEFFQEHILNHTLELQYSGEIDDAGCHAVDLINPAKKLLTEVMVELSLAEAKPASASAAKSAKGGTQPLKHAPKVIKHQAKAPTPPPAQRVVSSPNVRTFKSKDLAVATLSMESSLVTVTDVVSPLSFTAINVGELSELATLTEELCAYCGQTPADAGLNLSRGDLCCALYTADDQWYRAEVIDLLSPAQLRVRFIDYGNVENQDLSNLRPFKEDFMRVKAQGVRCALKGISENTEVPVTVTQEFSALVKEKVVECTRVGGRGGSEGISVVSLLSYNTDVQTDINKAVVDLLKHHTSSAPALSSVVESEVLRRELAELRAKMEQMIKLNAFKTEPVE